jgi:RHS repeat-associated protein
MTRLTRIASQVLVGLLAAGAPRALAQSTVSFSYDGDSNRLKQVTASATIVYPLGDDCEVSGGRVTKYITVAGDLVAKRVGTVTTWIHVDGQGSVRALSDGAGAEIEHLAYAPYGRKLAGGTSESRGYTGQRSEPSGLIYLHARYMDPQLGRFIGPDPVFPSSGNAGLNRYAYALNDAVNNVDTDGMQATPSMRAMNADDVRRHNDWVAERAWRETPPWSREWGNPGDDSMFWHAGRFLLGPVDNVTGEPLSFIRRDGSTSYVGAGTHVFNVWGGGAAMATPGFQAYGGVGALAAGGGAGLAPEPVRPTEMAPRTYPNLKAAQDAANGVRQWSEKFADLFRYEVRGGKFVRPTSGRELDTNGFLHIVTEDASGNYFWHQQDIGTLQHSTSVRGGPVRFAGMGIARGGRLSYVSNRSGHYGVDAYGFIRFLDSLRGQGMDLAGVKYEFYHPDGRISGGTLAH